MALRSVLDIDVNDTKLDALLTKLEKYKTASRNLPTISPGGGVTRPGGGRDGEHGERAVSNAERLARAWGTIREHSREVVRNVREMATRMLSLSGWLAALTGAATGFGFLGFNSLANSAAAQRQEAARAFTTIGGLRSSQIALGRFGNVNNMLSSLGAAAQTPGSEGWKALQMLQQAAQGTGREFQFQAGEDAAGLLDKVLPAIQAVMRNTPADRRGFMFDKLGLQNLGIGSFAEAQTLISRTPEELNAQISRRQGLARGLDIPENSARTFQDFVTTIETAGATIKNTLINQIVALAGPLGELSQTVTNLLQSFIKWALSKENVDAIAAALKRFADFLRDHDFAADWESLKNGFNEAAQAVKDFAAFVRGVVDFFSFKNKSGEGPIDTGPAKPLEQQQGAKPEIGGWGWDPETKSWRRFQGTRDQELQNAPTDPLFQRKTPSALGGTDMLSPIAFRGGAGGDIGIPVRATVPLPVEIVGFRGFSSANDDQPTQPESPFMQPGMIQQAASRFRIGANDNLDPILASIEKYESGGRNVFNYRHAENPTGFTASGFFQMIDSTWREAKKMAGISADQYPRAIDAPYDVQRDAAAALLRNRGLQPWETNEPLMRALREMAPTWGIDAPQRSAAPAAGTAPRRDFHPVRPPSVDVRIQNETGSNMVTTSRQLAV